MNGLVVVTVDFNLKPGAMTGHCSSSMRNAKCRVGATQGADAFAVLVPKGANHRIFLYEVYDSRAAFDTHLQLPHFAAFNKTSADLVVSKNVAEFDLIFQGSNNRR